MTLIDAATLIGTGLTLIAMIVTIKQASQAKSAASSAKEARDEIESRNAQYELSGLAGMVTTAIKAMDKFGPGTGAASLRGYSPDSDTKTVRALTSKMQQLSSLLNEKFGDDASAVIRRVNDLLVEFANASDDGERHKHGCSIYTEISEFNGNIHKVIDQSIYQRGQ